MPLETPVPAATTRPSGRSECEKNESRPAGREIKFGQLVKRFHESYERIVESSLERYYEQELPGLGAQIFRDKEMFDYTIKGGQCFRGVLVYAATLELLESKRENPSKEKIQQIMSVGWALEILQAAFLVADDIMDESHTRRGKACWHKVDRVHAYNDVFKLEHFAFYLLKEHLSGVELAGVQNVFRTVILKTTFGQGLDLEYSSQIKSLSVNWNPQVVREQISKKSYENIVKYKTSYYTFYLPLMASVCLAGYSPKSLNDVSGMSTLARPKGTLDTARGRGLDTKVGRSEWMLKIGLKLGEYFQVQDDFLDVYGDPKKTGKIGTDIEQRKLTWLMATAVQKADEKSLLSLFKASEKRVEIVKAQFKKLQLRKEYLEYEIKVCDTIKSWIQDGKQVLPAKTLHLILDKIYASRMKKEAKA
ncbi:hypothetical protein AAMO2058_001516300 [Amorphochlora amoebiformis]